MQPCVCSLWSSSAVAVMAAVLFGEIEPLAVLVSQTALHVDMGAIAVDTVVGCTGGGRVVAVDRTTVDRIAAEHIHAVGTAQEHRYIVAAEEHKYIVAAERTQWVADSER